MPYATLLNKTIEEKNIRIKDLAAGCKEYGVNITPSYISVLRNPDNKKLPSDEVSRAIAKVCGVDERLLVLEAYIDKAPKEFAEFTNIIRELMVQSILTMYSNQVSKEEMETIFQKLNNLPLSTFIIEMSNSINSEMTKEEGVNVIMNINDDNNHFIAELKEPIGFPVEDNSMYPVLQKESKVTLEMLDKYKDGDILYLRKKNDKSFMFRKVFYANDEKTKLNLIAVNQEYQSETVNISDIIIMGKVKSVTKNID